LYGRQFANVHVNDWTLGMILVTLISLDAFEVITIEFGIMGIKQHDKSVIRDVV